MEQCPARISLIFCYRKRFVFLHYNKFIYLFLLERIRRAEPQRFLFFLKDISYSFFYFFYIVQAPKKNVQCGKKKRLVRRKETFGTIRKNRQCDILEQIVRRQKVFNMFSTDFSTVVVKKAKKIIQCELSPKNPSLLPSRKCEMGQIDSVKSLSICPIFFFKARKKNKWCEIPPEIPRKTILKNTNGANVSGEKEQLVREIGFLMGILGVNTGFQRIKTNSARINP